MNRHKQNRDGEGQAGVVLIELVLILPVTLLVVILAIEISRCIQHIQTASMLSREAASLAYRECQDAPPKLKHCLNQVRDIVQGYAANVAPGAAIAVSIFHFEPGTSSMTTGQSDPVDGLVSSFFWDNARIRGTGEAKDLSVDFHSDQRVVSIGEALIPFKPLIPGVARLFSITTGNYYHATII